MNAEPHTHPVEVRCRDAYFWLPRVEITYGDHAGWVLIAPPWPVRRPLQERIAAKVTHMVAAHDSASIAAGKRHAAQVDTIKTAVRAAFYAQATGWSASAIVRPPAPEVPPRRWGETPQRPTYSPRDDEYDRAMNVYHRDVRRAEQERDFQQKVAEGVPITHNQRADLR